MALSFEIAFPCFTVYFGFPQRLKLVPQNRLDSHIPAAVAVKNPDSASHLRCQQLGHFPMKEERSQAFRALLHRIACLVQHASVSSCWLQNRALAHRRSLSWACFLSAKPLSQDQVT
jgi:hypothetical protein